MKPITGIRIPVAGTAVLLTLCVAYGWKNMARISGLREDQRKLREQSQSTGLSFDPAIGKSVVTKRPRIDRLEEARRISADFIRHSKEMSALGSQIDLSDGEVWKRIDDQIQRILAMDAAQLGILIDSVTTSEDLDDTTRVQLLTFAIGRLALDHPHEALRFLADPDGPRKQLDATAARTNELMGILMADWAKTDPEAAKSWCDTNPHHLPETAMDEVVLRFLHSVKLNDVGLAMRLAERFGEKQQTLVLDILKDTKRDAKSMTRSLTLLREWRERSAGREWMTDEVFRESLTGIMMGRNYQAADFEAFTGWIENAGLTAEEVTIFHGMSVKNLACGEDTCRWMEWFAKVMPPEKAGGLNWDLAISMSREDPDAMAGWLESAAPGAARNTAARAYAEVIFDQDREQAIRWLLTVPEEDQRMETLKRFRARWPKDDEAGRSAFEKQHGLVN